MDGKSRRTVLSEWVSSSSCSAPTVLIGLHLKMWWWNEEWKNWRIWCKTEWSIFWRKPGFLWPLALFWIYGWLWHWHSHFGHPLSRCSTNWPYSWQSWRAHRTSLNLVLRAEYSLILPHEKHPLLHLGIFGLLKMDQFSLWVFLQAAGWYPGSIPL